jgi:hypothetical protein
MRLRVPSRRGDRAFFLAVEAQLRGLPGIRQLRTNWRTGGILVLQEGNHTASLADAARERGLFDIRPQGTTDRARPRSGSVRPWRDPLPALAVGFAGLGAYQAVRGRLFGNAVSSLWHAYRLHRARESPWLSAGLAGIGAYQLARGRRILGPASALFIYAYTAYRMARQGDGGATAE